MRLYCIMILGIVHRNWDRHGEATEHYRCQIFNITGKATVSVKEATPFAYTILAVCYGFQHICIHVYYNDKPCVAM